MIRWIKRLIVGPRRAEHLWMSIAWHLPKTRCAVRVGANATQGKWEQQLVPELTMMEALKRWE